jgi:hypothetical protein
MAVLAKKRCFQYASVTRAWVVRPADPADCDHLGGAAQVFQLQVLVGALGVDSSTVRGPAP